MAASSEGEISVFASAVAAATPLVGDSTGIDTEVAQEYGEPGTGVSAARDPDGVVSVVDDDGMPIGSGEPSTSLMTGGFGGSAIRRGLGEVGGVGRSNAFCTKSAGGKACGDIIIPGALSGLPGRRDQTTNSRAIAVNGVGPGDGLRDVGALATDPPAASSEGACSNCSSSCWGSAAKSSAGARELSA